MKTLLRLSSNKLLIIGADTEHLLCADTIQGEEHWEWVLGALTPCTHPQGCGDLTPGPGAP